MNYYGQDIGVLLIYQDLKRDNKMFCPYIYTCTLFLATGMQRVVGSWECFLLANAIKISLSHNFTFSTYPLKSLGHTPWKGGASDLLQKRERGSSIDPHLLVQFNKNADKCIHLYVIMLFAFCMCPSLSEQ